MRLAIGCLLLAIPAFAQLDSAALRTKFGAPLNRETFHTPLGFELVVDYGKNHEVCKLEIPAEPKSEMERFLLELVPDSVRGKELTSGQWIVGGLSVSSVLYEHVIVQKKDVSGRPETLSVEFRKEACQH
jgi:hypothetical protein